MPQIVSRRVFLGFGSAGLVAACGGPAFEWKPETPAERELRVSQERLQRTVGEGGLFGAGAGALIGGLVGGVGGAVRGAEIGRLGGAGAGLYVKKLQEQFATREAQLGQLLTDLQATNVRLEASLAALRSVIAEEQSRAASGDADATRSQRNADVTRSLIEAAEGQESFFDSARSLVLQSGPGPDGGTNAELELLRSRISTLKEVSQDLAAL